MEPDFKVKVDESNKRIDIAIFESGSDHTPENVRRLVVCQKELKLGDKGAYKMRDHEQAAKDLDSIMVTSRHKSERVARGYIQRETLHERGAGEGLL